MTIPVLKIKALQRPLLKGKMDVRFPANVAVDQFLTVLKANGTYTFGVDYTLIGEAPILDPTTAMVVIWDETADTYKLQSLSSLLESATQIEQHITEAGPVDVLPNAGIVRVDQTVGAAMTLNMPLSTVKTCPVLLSDWKGDAGTNNITVNAAGSETFPGGVTSFKIDGDTASRFLRPIPGVGYAW
ncbi:MAG: hypothetical protein E6Q98_20700 [Rhodospirillaceae bacterium]|nr:MAG: hypothetical protein E6Q98_20700 [Rhodospirillaceae bacterium]